MYLRTTQRTNKDGSVTRYVQLAHNFWDARAGCAKAKVLYNFGRAEQVDRAALERLVGNIRRFLGPDAELQGQASDAGDLRYLGSRAWGGVWALDELWRRLGIAKVVRSLVAAHRFETPVERLLFALVANRALAPSSKLAIEEWVAEEVAVPGLASVGVQQLYRAMDFLLSAEAELQHQVYRAVADVLSLEVDLLFFDTTSTYFEVEAEDELRRFGHSKDHRPDRPQAVIGFAVTRQGIPVRVWVWPGNTADVSVISEVKRDLIGWQLGRVVTVLDRGFVSEENLRTLQLAGGHYIVGEKLRGGKADIEQVLGRAGRYTPVVTGVEVKEVVVGDGEARRRYLLVRNPAEAQRDRAQREATLGELRERLAALKAAKGNTHSKLHCALRSHATFGRWLIQDARGRLVIDERKVHDEARLDGKYILRTSDDTLSPEDVVLGYRQLYEVEDAFRTLKQTLELRPVYHRTEQRIRAHVILCWLGLLLIRVAEVRTGRTWSRIRTLLQRIRLGSFIGPHGSFRQRSELSQEQKGIYAALGIAEPPLLAEVTPAAQHNAAAAPSSTTSDQPAA